MDNVQTPALPSNLSEKTFRHYEPFILRALTAWPKDTQYPYHEMVAFDGTTRLSPNTFAARFRDSLVSLRKYTWTTTINVDKLWSITGEYVIAHDSDGSVWFRHRERKGRPTQNTAEARERGVAVGADVDRGAWKDITLPEIKALCTLLHFKRINGPIILDLVIGEADQIALELDYNVSLFYDSSINKTIVQ